MYPNIKHRCVPGAVINIQTGVHFTLEHFILSVLLGNTDTHRKGKKSKAF